MSKFYYLLSLLAATTLPVQAQDVTYTNPEVPKNVRFIDDPSTGIVTLTWDPVTKDLNGNNIPSEDMGYFVYETLSGATIAKVTTNKFTRFEYGPGQRVALQYSLRAQILSAKLSSSLYHSKTTVLGEDFTIPCRESYRTLYDMSGLITGNMLKANSGQLVTVCTDKTYVGITSQDEDNGYVFCGSSAYPFGHLVSGNVKLDKATKPEFTFWKLSRGEKDKNILKVIVNCENRTDTVLRAEDVETVQKWVRYSVDLSAYKGKKVNVEVLTTLNLGVPTAIFDNFRFIDKANKNMAACELSGPGTLTVDEIPEFKAIVENVGETDVASYNVVLYRNGKEVNRQQLSDLKSLRSNYITISDPTPPATSTAKYYVAVEYEGDEIAYDNVTDEITVNFVSPGKPSPVSLSASGSDNVTLNWQAPSTTVPSEFTTKKESFEDYTIFEIRDTHFGEWKLIDVDGGYSVGRVNDFKSPFYLNPKTFQVVSNDVHGLNTVVLAQDGEKYLAAFGPMTSTVPQDDWFISPKLQPIGQTVTMYLRAPVSRLTVNYTLCYSTTDRKPESFKEISSATLAVGGWTEVKFQVPQGSKYFALHFSNMKLGAILMLDNVSYIPMSMEPGLSITGYNIYRNGEKINATPVTGTTYTDSNAPADARYSVSAVYATGESVACAEVGAMSGVEDISPEAQVLSTRYFNIQGFEVDAASLVKGNVYIKVETLTSGKSRSSKMLK